MSMRPTLIFEIGTTVLSKLVAGAVAGGADEGKVSNAAICAEPGGHKHEYITKTKIISFRLLKDHHSPDAS
jgi:hypothetical protein